MFVLVTSPCLDATDSSLILCKWLHYYINLRHFYLNTYMYRGPFLKSPENLSGLQKPFFTICILKAKQCKVRNFAWRNTLFIQCTVHIQGHFIHCTWSRKLPLRWHLKLWPHLTVVVKAYPPLSQNPWQV